MESLLLSAPVPLPFHKLHSRFPSLPREDRLRRFILGGRLCSVWGEAKQRPGVAMRRRSLVVHSVAAFSELAPTTAAVYGTLLLGGGMLAYARTASKGSLFGGLTGGVLLGLVYFLLSSSETKDLGDAIGFGTAVLFVAVFGIRLAASRKVFPAAPLLILSVIACTVFMGAYLQNRV
eukprot:c19016_g1_i1 orf=91-621(+)